MRFRGAGVDVVAVNRKIPASHAAALELPDEVARCRVDRLDAGRAREIHDAVVHERRRLVGARHHRPRPRKLQLADVGARDLVERAVSPRVLRAPPVEPVCGIRIPQHLFGDELEIPDLCLRHGESHAQHDARDRNPDVSREARPTSRAECFPDEPRGTGRLHAECSFFTHPCRSKRTSVSLR